MLLDVPWCCLLMLYIQYHHVAYTSTSMVLHMYVAYGRWYVLVHWPSYLRTSYRVPEV